MKIYISCDMEGTAGVATWTQCDPNNLTEYPHYRRLMSREVAAAIEGARSAGATEFLINDSHSAMRNLMWDELPPDVRMIVGSRKPFSMVQGGDASCSGAFFTGYHAPIGALDGTLAHTYAPSSIYRVTVNGIECSEATLNAALLGTQNVPVLMITGDSTTVDHAKSQMPWITGVVVKESYGYYSVNSISPAAAQQAIADGAREAVGRIAEARAFTFDTPVTLQIETVGAEHADFMEMIPGFRRAGGRTVVFSENDYRAVFQAFITAFRLGYVASEKA